MAEYADKYLGQIPDMIQGQYSEKFPSPMRKDGYVETISGRDMTINFPCINHEGLPNVNKQSYELYDDKQKSELYDDKQMSALYDGKQKSALYDGKLESALYDDKQKSALYDGKLESALYDDKQKSALYDDKQKSALYDGKLESALYDDKQKSALYDDKQKSALYDDKQRSELFYDLQKSGLNNVMNQVSGAQNKTDRVEVETGTWETSYDAITCSKGKFLFHHKDEIETFPLNKLKDKEDMMNKVMKRRLGGSSNENSPVKNSPVKKRKTDTDEQGLAGNVKKNIFDERISETHFREEGIGFDTGFEDIIAGGSEVTKGKQRLFDNWSTLSDSNPESTVEETNTVSAPKVKNDLHVDNCKGQSQQVSNGERYASCLSKSLEVFKGERSDSCLSNSQEVFKGERSDSCFSHMVLNRPDAESQPSGSSSKNVSTKQSLEIKVTIPPTVHRFKKDKDNNDSSNDNFVKLKSPSGHHKNKKGKDIPEELVKMSRPSVKLNIPFDKTEMSSAKNVQKSDGWLYEPKLLNVPVVDRQKDFDNDVDETDGDPCNLLKLQTKGWFTIFPDRLKKFSVKLLILFSYSSLLSYVFWCSKDHLICTQDICLN